MARQRVTITRTTRTRKTSGATVSKSSPAGKTKIGNSSGKPNTQARCPSCGKYR